MSLVEISRELEFVPNEQLLAMTKNPNSQYPSLLVLSEIQRRNKMDNIFKNQMAMQNKPTMSVAEETAQKLQNTGAVTTQNINPQMAPPVRKMQAGGDTSFAQDYQNYLSELALYDDAVAQANAANAPQPSFLSRTGDFLSDRYLGRGLGGLGTALLDASLLVPGFGLAGLGFRSGLAALRGTQLGQRFLPAKGDFLKSLVTRPGGPKAVDKARKEAAEKVIQSRASLGAGSGAVPKGKQMIPMGGANLPAPVGREFSRPRALGTALAAGTIANQFRDDSVPQQVNLPDRPEFRPRSVSDEGPRMSGLDMVRLGSIIGGSATQKELASGIGEFAKEKQLGKIAASDAMAESLLRQAQTGKALAEASNIPIKSLTDQIEALNKSYKDAFEAGETEEMARINMVRSTLINRLAMAQGLPVTPDLAFRKFQKTA